uniref:Putative secreted protein n=1 Tax=Anopheles darlingi TaxID=43151 RepID=A0A2M4DJY5_ANODA
MEVRLGLLLLLVCLLVTVVAQVAIIRSIRELLAGCWWISTAPDIGHAILGLGWRVGASPLTSIGRPCL